MKLTCTRVSDLPALEREPKRPALVALAPGEHLQRPTWKALVRHEPRLSELRAEIAAVRDPGGPSFCANDTWYARFKPGLVNLVGTYAERDDPLLATSAAYDLAYETCYRALPDCRDCWCLSREDLL